MAGSLCVDAGGLWQVYAQWCVVCGWHIVSVWTACGGGVSGVRPACGCRVAGTQVGRGDVWVLCGEHVDDPWRSRDWHGDGVCGRCVGGVCLALGRAPTKFRGEFEATDQTGEGLVAAGLFQSLFSWASDPAWGLAATVVREISVLPQIAP